MQKKKFVFMLFAYPVLIASFVRAASPDSPAEPDSPDSAMYTIEDVYMVLTTRTNVSRRSGPFTGPSGGPTNSTMHTLNDIMNLITNRAWVARTGQTVEYRENDDGALRIGVAWPDPRFTDNEDGTVTDNLTGLMWSKDANLPGGNLVWEDSIAFCNNMNGGEGTYGYNDWRLPNIRELFSLVDYSKSSPVLPAGHPFLNLSGTYWSSTTMAWGGTQAWRVSLNNGTPYTTAKTSGNRVFPVRGPE